MNTFEAHLDIEGDLAINSLLREDWIGIEIIGQESDVFDLYGVICDSVIIRTTQSCFLLQSVDDSIVGPGARLDIEIYIFSMRKIDGNLNFHRTESIEPFVKFNYSEFNRSQSKFAQIMYETEVQYWTGAELLVEEVVGVVFCGSESIMFGALSPGRMFINFEKEKILELAASTGRLELRSVGDDMPPLT